MCRSGLGFRRRRRFLLPSNSEPNRPRLRNSERSLRSLWLGLCFSTETVAEAFTEDPTESDAVAVQVTAEPTLASEAVTVYVLPVPTLEAPTVHA